jgi:predicted RNA-binding Zn-ribbon protein involved in translation (DUF1610 family)
MEQATSREIKPHAPRLLCPACDRRLIHRHTAGDDVDAIERWDSFECEECGSFVYRDRTRTPRPLA